MTQTPPPHGSSPDPTQDLEQGSAFQPQFNADGLIPAVVTDAATGDVLMFAWMNSQALRHSLETGIAHFWSRSRKKLWRKGEESGNALAIREIRVDCDQDVLWLKVSIGGDGVACHTGAKSCFYRVLPVGTGEPPKLVRSEL
jgi:phosphoribosyl-AMP cyclohydrolase